MREPVLLDVADVPEARLLEGAPRAAIGLLDGGHARVRLWAREDDLARERLERLRPDAAPDELFLADQEVDAGQPGLGADDRLPVGAVGDEVGLDEAGRPALDDDQVLVGPALLDPPPPLVDRLLDRIAPPAIVKLLSMIGMLNRDAVGGIAMTLEEALVAVWRGALAEGERGAGAVGVAFFLAQLERDMERRAIGLAFALRLKRG